MSEPENYLQSAFQALQAARDLDADKDKIHALADAMEMLLLRAQDENQKELLREHVGPEAGSDDTTESDGEDGEDDTSGGEGPGQEAAPPETGGEEE